MPFNLVDRYPQSAKAQASRHCLHMPKDTDAVLLSLDLGMVGGGSHT
jgi:hypothetical protein